MKDRRRGRKPLHQIKIARERMDMLLNRAMEARKEKPELSKRYFQLAKKIGMRYNVRMPKSAKRRFCKKCFSYLATGWRLKKGKLTVTCKACGYVMRYSKPTK